MITKSALLICCSKHILLLNFFEDPVVLQTFNKTKIYRHDLRAEIRKYEKYFFFGNKQGEWATLALNRGCQTGKKFGFIKTIVCVIEDYC
jgi:hypothetical protein